MGLLFLLWAGEVMAADPLTAERAEANYRRTFRPVEALRCPPATSPDEVVVCGRREGPDPNRVPFPNEREPGARVRLLPGELPRASASVADPCAMAGPNHPCGGSMAIVSLDPDQHTLIGGLTKIARHLLGGDR